MPTSRAHRRSAVRQICRNTPVVTHRAPSHALGFDPKTFLMTARSIGISDARLLDLVRRHEGSLLAKGAAAALEREMRGVPALTLVAAPERE